MSYEQDYILDEYELEPESWEELEPEEKTAFIAAIIRQGEDLSEADSSLDELERLADTAGIAVLGRYTQKRQQPERSTFFGKGFLSELSQKMYQAGADLLIVNEELSPMQGRNIEKTYQIKVIDRTEVILAIFHDHARTGEAKLQVRLAELHTNYPGCASFGVTSIKNAAAPDQRRNSYRGMGEKQIESIKRLIREQISKINRGSMPSPGQANQRKQREKSRRSAL
jgi:GTP-binding protein HflX